MASSSAKRPCERQLPRRKAPKAGTLYLYSQLQELDTVESPFIVEADESNITKWSVGVSSGALKEQLDLGRLAGELEKWSKLAKKPPVILMEIVFPANYPEGVPFVRMVRPRFCFHTGHVTVGGSLCTELLTHGGWTPMTIHALLLTICQMLREGGARIQLRPDEHCLTPLIDYHANEARAAFERVARDHGWSTRRP